MLLKSSVFVLITLMAGIVTFSCHNSYASSSGPFADLIKAEKKYRNSVDGTIAAFLNNEKIFGKVYLLNRTALTKVPEIALLIKETNRVQCSDGSLYSYRRDPQKLALAGKWLSLANQIEQKAINCDRRLASIVAFQSVTILRYSLNPKRLITDREFAGHYEKFCVAAAKHCIRQSQLSKGGVKRQWLERVIDILPIRETPGENDDYLPYISKNVSILANQITSALKLQKGD